MNKLTIYIARHGKTLMNTLDKVQGWCDSPLTDEGIEVAGCLGRGMRDIHFRKAYCSDLRRTLQTAKIVLKNNGQENLPIQEIGGLREACFGKFEADYNHEMWERVALYYQYLTTADMFQAIVDKKMDYKRVMDVICRLDTMGMAEDFDTLETRTQNALKEIAEREAPQGEGNILVISHGMSILCMLYNLGGSEVLQGSIENASVCKVTYENGRFFVETMGDMSYVEKGRKEKVIGSTCLN